MSFTNSKLSSYGKIFKTLAKRLLWLVNKKVKWMRIPMIVLTEALISCNVCLFRFLRPLLTRDNIRLLHIQDSFIVFKQYDCRHCSKHRNSLWKTHQQERSVCFKINPVNHFTYWSELICFVKKNLFNFSTTKPLNIRQYLAMLHGL